MLTRMIEIAADSGHKICSEVELKTKEKVKKSGFEPRTILNLN